MRWRYLALATVLVGAVLFVLQFNTTSAAEDDGAMAVDCDAGTAGVQANCAYASGATFSIQVHVTKAPAGGYFLFQAKVRWNEAALDYLPAASMSDEALWPACTIGVRFDKQPAPPNGLGEPSVVFGCLPIPSLSTGDTFTGAVLQFQFQCQQDGHAPLELVPRPGDAQGGTLLVGVNIQAIEPELTGATVLCGGRLTIAPASRPVGTAHRSSR